MSGFKKFFRLKINLIKKVSTLTFSFLVFLFLFLGIMIVYAWTEPTAAPPGSNVSAPINVGGSTQYKSGALGIGGIFQTDTDAYFSGSVGIGTTAPSYELDVNGTANFEGTITNLYNKKIKQGNDATISSDGWYRIAQTSGNRASGLFNIMDMTGSRHQSVYFYASAAYPSGANSRQLSVNILSNTRYSINTFSKIRLVRKSTYDPVYLEVYVENTSNNSVRYILSQDDWDSGWTPVDWAAGSIPTDYVAIEYPITDINLGINGNLLVVKDDGNIGIGTASPGYKLDVQGGQINASGGLCIAGTCKEGWSEVGGTPAGANGYVQFNDNGSFGGDSNLFWDNTNKRLGIGTSSPSSKLTVAGTGASNGITIGDAFLWDEGTWFHIQHNAVNSWWGGGNIYFNLGDTAGSNKFYIRDSGSNTVSWINSDGTAYFAGNVGIGVTSFAMGERLAISDGTTKFGIFPGYLDNVANADWVTLDIPGTKGLRVWDNFSVSGNVGIGTSSPATKLEVYGSADSLFRLTRSGGTNPTIFKLGTDDAMVINNSGVDTVTLKGGNVGVGTTPGYKLDINGSLNASSYFGPLVATPNGGYSTPTDGLNATSIYDRITYFDGYGASVPNSPDGSWWEGALTIGSSNRGIQIAGGYNTEFLYFRKGANGWRPWHKIISENESGNVGIGTNSPGYKLDVQGGQINASGGLCIAGVCKTGWGEVGGTPAGANGYVQFNDNGSFGGDSNLFWDNTNKRLGIGTSSPRYELDVNGNIAAVGFGVINSSGPGSMMISSLVNNDSVLTFREETPPGTYNIRWYLYNDGDVSDRFVIANENTSHIIDIQQGGNVGIGTKSPAQKLHVAGNLRVDGAIVAPEGTIRDDGGGWVRTYGKTGWYSQTYGGGWYMYDTTWIRAYNNKAVYSGGEIRSGSNMKTPILYDLNNTAYYLDPASTGNSLLVAGNIGIGTTTPGARLNVDKGIAIGTGSGVSTTDGGRRSLQFLTDTAYGGTYNAHTGYLVYSTMPGGWGTAQLHFARSTGWGTYDSSPTMTLSGGNTVVIGGGSGKLTVGTIDPVYNIGGEKYLTYLSGMTGQKEETAGTVILKQNDNRKAVYQIDFANLEKDSDLWLFHKITDFGKNWEKLVVLLTPNFEGDVWYKKDVRNNKLMIYGSKEGEVSYRLTAPRFDWQDWSNISNDQTIEGLNVP